MRWIDVTWKTDFNERRAEDAWFMNLLKICITLLQPKLFSSRPFEDNGMRINVESKGNKQNPWLISSGLNWSGNLSVKSFSAKKDLLDDKISDDNLFHKINNEE